MHIPCSHERSFQRVDELSPMESSVSSLSGAVNAMNELAGKDTEDSATWRPKRDPLGFITKDPDISRWIWVNSNDLTSPGNHW